MLSEPGSPELSGDEDNVEGEDNSDEPAFLTGDEWMPEDDGLPAHVEILARDQLTADFQLHAARAGTLLNTPALAERV